MVLEVVFILIEIKYKLGAAIARFLNLFYLDKEEAFLCDNHVFIGFLNVNSLDNFDDVTDLDLVLIFFVFIVPVFQSLMLFDSELDVKRSCDAVASGIENFDDSIFTSHDCEVVGVSVE